MTLMATTAADIVRALRQRQFQNHTAALANLTNADADAVARELSRVSKRARVDLSRLIEAVRQERLEAEARARANCQPWRYAVLLMSDDEVAEFKRLVADGVDLNAAATRVMSSALAPQARRSTLRIPSKRRSVQRIPSKRAQQQMQPVDRAERARPIAQEPALPAAKVFGSSLDDRRPFGAPEGVDYAAWRNPARPPWLLSSGDDGDEDDASLAITDEVAFVDELDDDECDDD